MIRSTIRVYRLVIPDHQHKLKSIEKGNIGSTAQGRRDTISETQTSLPALPREAQQGLEKSMIPSRWTRNRSWRRIWMKKHQTWSRVWFYIKVQCCGWVGLFGLLGCITGSIEHGWWERRIVHFDRSRYQCILRLGRSWWSSCDNDVRYLFVMLVV